MTLTHASRRTAIPETSNLNLALEIGGLDVTRKGDEIIPKSRDPRLDLGLNESTSFSQTVSGPLGEYLRKSFFGQRDPSEPISMHGAWSTSFPALRCTLALGPEGKETATLSGYLEPSRDGKAVVLTNPSGEMYPGLEHKSPTAGDLIKVARGPAKLLEATLLAHLSIRGESPGEIEAPITILDRSSAPSKNSAIEALADLQGHYVRIFRASLTEHNEAIAEKADPTRNASSLSGMVKSVSDKGVVTIVRPNGQETEIKPERHIIYQVDHVQIPACWDWSRQGQHSEMLNENKYISDRFKRGAPIEVTFSERIRDAKGLLSKPSTQTIKGHFLQILDTEKHGLLIAIRDTTGALVAIPRSDIQRMETTKIGRSTEWEDRYEVRTTPEKEQPSSGFRLTIGSTSDRAIPCSAEWGHTFFGTGWTAPDSIS